MTPATIRKAAEALANETVTRSDARSQGAVFGRGLAAEVRARKVASQQMNGAVALDMELELLKLAAGNDEFVAELADSALQVLRAQRLKPG